MPQINGADAIAFHVVGARRASEAQRVRSELAALRQELSSDDGSGHAENAIRYAELSIARISWLTVRHELTIHPAGDPGWRYYIEKHKPLDLRYDYDVSPYLDVLYVNGIELRNYPLALAKFFDAADVDALLAVTQPPKAHRGLAHTRGWCRG